MNRKIDLFFSYAPAGEGGTKTGEVSLAEVVAVSWDGEARRYQASNAEANAATGSGPTLEAAILDYLRARLGQAQATARPRNSKRLY
jgi:hypothetical protein